MNAAREPDTGPRQEFVAILREPAAADFDLRRVIVVLRRWRIVVASAFLFCLAVAVLYAILSPEVYRAQIVAVPVTETGLGAGVSFSGGALGGLASLAGIRVGGDASKRAEILTVLRSQEFLERFIVDNDLLPALFPKRWDTNAKRWLPDADEIPTVTDGFAKLSEKLLRISEDTETGLVTIAIEWTDRDVVADWVSRIIDRLNSQMKQQAIKEANASLAFLDEKLNATDRLETRQAVYQLMEAQLNKAMLAEASDEFALRTVDHALKPAANRFVRPKRMFVLFAGALAGGLLALFSAFLLEALWPSTIPRAADQR